MEGSFLDRLFKSAPSMDPHQVLETVSSLLFLFFPDSMHMPVLQMVISLIVYSAVNFLPLSVLICGCSEKFYKRAAFLEMTEIRKLLSFNCS